MRFEIAAGAAFKRVEQLIETYEVVAELTGKIYAGRHGSILKDGAVLVVERGIYLDAFTAEIENLNRCLSEDMPVPFPQS